MLFENLSITLPIQRALQSEGYREATPIQEQAIPPLLEGRDLLGCAQTGTGKTAAFAIPILQGLASEQRNLRGNRQIQSLILAPTRELAIQIGESFKTYGKHLGLRTMVIFGGVSQNPQTNELGRGVDILVATPGRLLDLIGQKYVKLGAVKYFVLDEADMMLDMGMIHDVRKIITHLPTERQTMFFSATMPTEISRLADSILNNPVRIQIAPGSPTVDVIDQELYFVNRSNKTNLLIHLLKNKTIESALVFSRTKHGADKIVKALEKAGLQAQAIHGNKSQNARQLALSNFKERKTRILVATDIAARGIDVDELSHVIIFDLPEVPETYVHRIGRTGRAGLGGIAISFCSQEEIHLLKDVERLIGKPIPVIENQLFPMTEPTSEERMESAREAANTRNSYAKKQQRSGSGSSNSSWGGSSRNSSSRNGSSRNTSSDSSSRDASSKSGAPKNNFKKKDYSRSGTSFSKKAI